jgi:ribosomal protein L7/L12
MLGDLRKAYKLWLESDPSSITEQRWATSLANQFHELDAHLSAGGPLPADWDVAPETAYEATARRLVAEGKKIQAIKEVRAATGWSLMEAKTYVDRL